MKIGDAAADVLLQLWLKQQNSLTDPHTDISKALDPHLAAITDRRRVQRALGRMAEQVAKKLGPYFEVEYRGSATPEVEAVALLGLGHP